MPGRAADMNFELGPMTQLFPIAQLTREEIDALMVAVAQRFEPGTQAQDAWEAASVIWKHAGEAGTILTSLATMFAETRGPS